MAEIVNLNKARKDRVRQARALQAAENRIRHGQPKLKRLEKAAEVQKAERELDGKHLD